MRRPVRLSVAGPVRPARDNQVPPRRCPRPVVAHAGIQALEVRSRLSLADYSRCAHDLGFEPRRFLDEFNPDVPQGRGTPDPQRHRTAQPEEGHARILLINNSSLPYAQARMNPLGALHKAEILNQDESERRIVNSIMLATGGPQGGRRETLRAFVAAEEISQKFYG